MSEQEETTSLEEITLEEQEAEGETQAAEAAATPEDESEVIVTIGDEKPTDEEPAAAPAWVKELRKANRELHRENKELKERVATTETKPFGVAELLARGNRLDLAAGYAVGAGGSAMVSLALATSHGFVSPGLAAIIYAIHGVGVLAANQRWRV